MWRKSLILMAVIHFLTACSVISSVASYSVTSEQLDKALAKQLDKLAKKSSVAGVPVLLEVAALHIDIGPNNRKVVSLLADAKVTVSVFGLSYPAKLNLGLEGEPFYNAKENAIYVRSLAITRSEIDAGGFKGNLSSVAEKYLSMFTTFLAEHPVHQIDTTKPGLGWLATMPLTLVIEPGKLIFKPQLTSSNT